MTDAAIVDRNSAILSNNYKLRQQPGCMLVTSLSVTSRRHYAERRRVIRLVIIELILQTLYELLTAIVGVGESSNTQSPWLVNLDQAG